MIPPKPRDLVELTSRDLTVLLAPPSIVRPPVIVAVAVHGIEHDLARCLDSIAEQDIETALLGVIVLLDCHLPVPFSPALPPRLRERTWVLRGNCGSPARARNAMLEFVESHLGSCRWIARMDWDDRFAERSSLRVVVETGEAANAKFVIGGNRVLDRGGRILRDNPAGNWLINPPALVERLGQMACGSAENELPSCNLLIRSGLHTRYPDTKSAEDHWLVANLLMHRTADIAVAESALYADYTLDGCCTSNARATQQHRATRVALSEAAQTWLGVLGMPGQLLGLGQEGIVKLDGGKVVKYFYPGILTPEKVSWLEEVLADGQDIVPVPRFAPGFSSGMWTATYPWEPTRSIEFLSSNAVSTFLNSCLKHKLVCGNIKRSNFRVREDGRLLYIDVGNWIVPMDVSVLRDSAARLYSIGVLGASDEELLRRPADHSRPVIWDRLPGFSDFYGQTVGGHLQSNWRRRGGDNPCLDKRWRRPDVTLLIKACAMDAPYAEHQVRHLVQQLASPSDFAERVLAIDPYEGPFLREHNAGDMKELKSTAARLCVEGLIDRVMVAPCDTVNVQQLNLCWFGLDSPHTHSSQGIPVTPQTWAFDQVRTKYVLQCDIDILVGRRDRAHGYLDEMIAACQPSDVVSVAFNIPHAPDAPPNPYQAAPGEFKPEVRCGLIDLDRLKAARPLPNVVVDGRLAEPWYRALHAHQRARGLRTPRGGDGRTFYIHPINTIKTSQDLLARVRDLVSQGHVPASYWGKWDVGLEAENWRYTPRGESVVVVARGRNTPLPKLDRFAAGLEMQTDQTFGVIAIDDASNDSSPRYLQERLQFLGARLTLIRHAVPHGYMPNNILAIRGVCSDPNTAVVVVDLDDALVDISAIRSVRSLFARSHDVVLAAPFRPDVPTKVYQPDFQNPRATFGGDVWIHLRAFAKRLFDRLPDDALQLDGQWLRICDDYATMVPIVEMANSPIYIPEFWYWHERTTLRGPVEREENDRTILRLLSKARMSTSGPLGG